VSDLLAHALTATRRPAAHGPDFQWIAKPMGARIDLRDKQALLDAMDETSR
jgi:hypothetical protein